MKHLNLSDFPKTAKEAKARGLPQYYNGKPCKHGHIKPRSVSGNCMECLRIWKGNHRDHAARKKYYLENRDRELETNKKYIQENKKRLLELAKGWRGDNRARIAEANAKWRKQNPSYAKNHKRQNPEYYKAYSNNRRCRLSGGKLSVGIVEKLFQMQRGCCACCGKKLGDEYHLDHIIPLVRGGKNEDWNVQLLTGKCNLKKGSRDPLEYMQSVGKLL